MIMAIKKSVKKKVTPMPPKVMPKGMPPKKGAKVPPKKKKK